MGRNTNYQRVNKYSKRNLLGIVVATYIRIDMYFSQVLHLKEKIYLSAKATSSQKHKYLAVRKGKLISEVPMCIF